MVDLVKTPEQIRAERRAAIDNINRLLDRAVTETRDSSGRFTKRDLTTLYRRRDELVAEDAGQPDVDGGAPHGRVRQLRMIGRKGY